MKSLNLPVNKLGSHRSCNITRTKATVPLTLKEKKKSQFSKFKDWILS